MAEEIFYNPLCLRVCMHFSLSLSLSLQINKENKKIENRRIREEKWKAEETSERKKSKIMKQQQIWIWEKKQEKIYILNKYNSNNKCTYVHIARKKKKKKNKEKRNQMNKAWPKYIFKKSTNEDDENDLLLWRHLCEIIGFSERPMTDCLHIMLQHQKCPIKAERAVLWMDGGLLLIHFDVNNMG